MAKGLYNRPLGKTQREILRLLIEHKKWFEGCGWIWMNSSKTASLLEGLIKRGLVVSSMAPTPAGLRQRVVYRPTPDAAEALRRAQ